MPTWICPECDSAMTVKQSLIGSSRGCVKCKAVSVVTDVDATDGSAVDSPLPRINATALKRLRPGADGPQFDQSVGSWAKLLLGIAAFVMLASSFALASNPKGESPAMLCVAGGISTLVLAILMWPIYTMAADVRACRTLLEQIAKK